MKKKTIVGIIFTILFCAVSFCAILFSVHWPSVKNILIELWNNDGPLKEQISKYSDIIIAVIAAVITALMSISITMYVFLKSALDRVIDENQYMSQIATIYQTETTSRLGKTAVVGLALLFSSLSWHFLLDFQVFSSQKDHKCLLIGLALCVVLFIYDLYLTIVFWLRCIGLRSQLRKIIKREKETQEKKMLTILRDTSNLPEERSEETDKEWLKSQWFMIGYWDQWDTDALDQLIEQHGGDLPTGISDTEQSKEITDAGEKLCTTMSPDQFINLFSKAETLLLSGAGNKAQGKYDQSAIVTVIQERADISTPTIEVESKDLSGKSYGGSKNYIHKYLTSFRSKLGYQKNETKDFFIKTEELYKALRYYCDLALSERNAVGRKISSKKAPWKMFHKADSQLTTGIDCHVATCMYLFYLRVIAMFVSAVTITDFTFNGNTLNFANFYNSTLTNISFYGAQFYHTIFARTRFQHSALDLSDIDSVLFFHTNFAHTSLNNSRFTNARFENVRAQDSDLSICVFRRVDLLNSTFNNSTFSGSEFLNSQVKNTDFSRSQLSDIKWKNTDIDSCSFTDADIKGWKWDNNAGRAAIVRRCDFSRSSWDDMDIGNADLTEGIFDSASMSGTRFENVQLNNALFRNCQLAAAKFLNCKELTQASFQGANLFGAKFDNCIMEKSNLYQSSCSESIFVNSNLRNSDCSEVYFRNATLCKAHFDSARLYGTSLDRATIKHCCFTYILADHLQFTFAQCKETDFTHASMVDSDFSGTVFEKCKFLGSDLSESTASCLRIINCTVDHVSFADTRFIDLTFEDQSVLNSDFSRCRFEKGRIQNAMFISCQFSDAFFLKRVSAMSDSLIAFLMA